MLMTETQSNKNQPVEDFVSIARAVRYSGYAEQYLRRMAREGKIHALKFGFFWMIDLKSLQAYMDQAASLNARDKRYGPRQPEE